VDSSQRSARESYTTTRLSQPSPSPSYPPNSNMDGESSIPLRRWLFPFRPSCFFSSHLYRVVVSNLSKTFVARSIMAPHRGARAPDAAEVSSPRAASGGCVRPHPPVATHTPLAVFSIGGTCFEGGSQTHAAFQGFLPRGFQNFAVRRKKRN